jgi:hypothetical protein
MSAGTSFLQESHMRYPLWISFFAVAAMFVLSGCRQDTVGDAGDSRAAHVTVSSGTSLQVTLGTSLSSENAGVGDAWSGSVVNGRDGIPAGSVVSGRVSAVRSARKGDRAMIDLQLTSISAGGRNYAMHGGTEAIIAGSTRARNLGAIAGSAVAGALIGRAVGGSGKGAVVGGVVGGAAATGVVAGSKGYQVVLKSGTPLTFTTSEAVAVRQ